MSCLTCQYFYSYRDIYEDPLEDSDLGICQNMDNPDYDTQVSDSDTENCDFYKPLNLNYIS